MPGETDVVAVDAANQEADDAAFNAGFEADVPTETPDQKPSSEQEEVPTKATEEPAPKLAQITEEQFQDLLTKASRVDEIRAAQEKSFGTAFGKIGGIERVLSQLQTSASGGQGIEVTADDFAELRAEFPELADLQAKGLNKILGKLKGPATADPSAIEQMVSTRVADTKKQLVDAHLDAVIDGDWVAEVNSEQYKRWIPTQPDEVKSLAASESVRDAARLLRLFKSAKTEASAATKPSTRKQQLEAAVTPRGAGGHTRAPSADDDFNAGFNGQ